MTAADDGRAAAAARTEARERRIVTVLYADLSGFTAVAETMDPEEVHAFVAPVMDEMISVVAWFGGTVVQTMGDGFLAVFGAPVAHNDDPQRAVLAAFALRETVRRLERPDGDPWALHAGIQTGWVLAVDRDGALTVTGDTVNTGARILALAPSGVVLVGDETQRLTARAIGYRAWDPVVVKGKAEPLAVFEAVEALPSPLERFLAFEATPFVGRDRELAALREAAARARTSNRSQVIGLAGPPGIGKSRLAAELVAHLPDHDVLLGRCMTHGDRVPWVSVGGAIQRRAGIADGDRADVAHAKLESLIGTVLDGEAADDVARRVGALIGTAPAPPSRAHGSDLNLEAAVALRRLLSGLARCERPVLLIVEDVHGIDAQTAAFLRWVATEPWDAPVTMLAIGWAEAFEDLATTETIALGPMAKDETRALLQSQLADAQVTDAVAARIDERADGNPLFVEEIARLLRERGDLRVEEGRWTIDAARRPDVPASVELVVAARIDNLPPEGRRLLRDAAVCGDVFTEDLLGALGWGSGARAILDDLAARDLVLRRAPAGDGPARWAFRHGVIRDAAYGTLPRTETAEKHLAVAEHIRAHVAPGADEPVEALADHYRRAALARLPGLAGRKAARQLASLAATYLIRAGDRAVSHRAFREAETWYRQALDVSPPSAEDAAHPDGRAGVDALLRHTAALTELHGYEEARADAERALDIATRTGNRFWEADALLRLGRLDNFRADPVSARARLTRAEELFAVEGVTNGRAQAIRSLGDTYAQTDQGRMRELWGRAAELFAQAGNALEEQLLLEDLAFVLCTKGGDEFERWYARSAEATARAGDPRSRAALARTAGYHSFCRGDLTGALPALETAVALARETGDLFVEIDGTFLLARIRLAHGDPDAAEAFGQRLVRAGRSTELRRPEAEGLVVLSRAAMRQGRPDAARDLLHAAEDVLRRAGAEREMDEVRHARALNLVEAGAWDEALAASEAYERSIRRYGDLLDEPDAMLLIARAHLGAGRLDEAIDAFDRAASVGRAVGHHLVPAFADALAAEALALRGDAAAAGARLDLVVVDAALPELRAVLAEARGFVARAVGDHDAAGAHLREAVNAWRVLGVTVWLARAAAACGLDADVRATLERLGYRGDPEAMLRP